MRKIMLLAAMLAMVLAAAAPALAQAVGGDVDVQYVDCDQVQAAAAQQAQYGDASAQAGDLGSAAAADIAQELNISQEQVLACLGDVNVGGTASPTGTATATATGTATATATGTAAAAAGGALPETGGASLIALGAGALLVAGGLLARRIVR